jgi:4-amino-4-deoxychorismate lyase
MTTTLINGELISLIPVQDRAVQYGDGLFETIAWRNGKLELWPQHMARMQRGCQRLGMPIINEKIWLVDIKQLPLADNAVIKLIQSRGAGGRGYRYNADMAPTRVVSVYAWPDYPPQWAEQGVVIRLCQTPVSVNHALAGIKHLNRLDNVLARNEWQDADIAEGLMSNDAGDVIEGTMSNVFAVKNNVLLTPALQQSGVCGVMRERVMALAHAQSIPVTECNIKQTELFNMDEVFLTNSLIGIWPVKQLEQQSFNVGKVTCLLKQSLQMELTKYGSPV